ncbi:hypothetical protein D3C72_2254410 [compost metagenome]
MILFSDVDRTIFIISNHAFGLRSQLELADKLTCNFAASVISQLILFKFTLFAQYERVKFICLEAMV